MRATPNTLVGVSSDAAISSDTTRRSNIDKKSGSSPSRSLRTIPATITFTAITRRMPANCNCLLRFSGIAHRQHSIPIAVLVNVQGRTSIPGTASRIMGTSKIAAHNVPKMIRLATCPRLTCSRVIKLVWSPSSAGALKRYHHCRRGTIGFSC